MKKFRGILALIYNAVINIIRPQYKPQATDCSLYNLQVWDYFDINELSQLYLIILLSLDPSDYTVIQPFILNKNKNKPQKCGFFLIINFYLEHKTDES